MHVIVCSGRSSERAKQQPKQCWYVVVITKHTPASDKSNTEYTGHDGFYESSKSKNKRKNLNAAKHWSTAEEQDLVTVAPKPWTL